MMTDKALMDLICRLGQLHIEGNIVPPSWYQHLKYPSGKPYHIAITLLSEIVYWFRPRMVRDEHTGEFVGWAKKFKGDGIQRSYAAWGAPFGFTKRESADAMKYLVAEGLITTDIRDVTLPDGTLRPNVVVVTGVDPDRLRQITYNSRKQGVVPQDVIPLTGYSVSTEGVVPQNGTPSPGYDVSTVEVIPRKVGSSRDSAAEGMAPGRTCLENIFDTKLETILENTLPTGEKALSTTARPTDEVVYVNNLTGTPTLPETAGVTASVDGHVVETSIFPALLIRPKSRRAVLEQGQRPGRDDLVYPNVAAAHTWAGRAWQLALVQDVADAQAPAMLAALETLEGALAAVRERALRRKQLTFTQALDDFLREDEPLCAALLTAPSALARVAEFTGAIRDIIVQWDDAPSEDDLAALRAMLDDEEAA